METMVSVSGLVKRYGSKIAVNDVSFDVKKGEVVGLLGPNGAGKTSTLECIEGLREIDKGTVMVAGADVKTQSDHLKNLLGVQLQSSALPEDISVIEAMELVCAWHKVPVRKDLIIRFGLGGEMKKLYGHMSTGQKRRLQLALAMAANPAVVILDEPTAGLDVEGRAQLHAIIRELRNEGVTFLLATHDMAEAEVLCDRIVIIIKGQLAVSGTPAQVTSAGSHKTKITIQTAKRSLVAIKRAHAEFVGESEGFGVWMTDAVSKAVSELLQAADEANDSVIDLRVERPSLEERFLEIVGAEV